MLGVNISNSWILKIENCANDTFWGEITYVDISDDHGIAVGVEKVLAFGIAAKNNGLATVRSRQARINKFCKWGKN